MGSGKLKIGLGQGNILCGMRYAERLNFIGKGLPVILDSARGFWKASQELRSSHREATVLHNHAIEEVGKLLILIDIARCPEKLISRRIGSMMHWFYDHLARIIYAKSASWSAMSMAHLREYVDTERKAHFLIGENGQYIFPNYELFGRENALYADIEIYEDGLPQWSQPIGVPTLFPGYTPPALLLAEAFDTLGLLCPQGIETIAKIWSRHNFIDLKDTIARSEELVKATLEAAVEAGLASDKATEQEVNTIYSHWQMPMYNLEFALITVSQDELEKERTHHFLFDRSAW